MARRLLIEPAIEFSCARGVPLSDAWQPLPLITKAIVKNLMPEDCDVETRTGLLVKIYGAKTLPPTLCAMDGCAPAENKIRMPIRIDRNSCGI